MASSIVRMSAAAYVDRHRLSAPEQLTPRAQRHDYESILVLSEQTRAFRGNPDHLEVPAPNPEELSHGIPRLEQRRVYLPSDHRHLGVFAVLESRYMSSGFDRDRVDERVIRVETADVYPVDRFVVRGNRRRGRNSRADVVGEFELLPEHFGVVAG